MRPVVVEYALRRLVAKCADAHVVKRRSDEMQPIQVGVGVSGAAEAVMNVTRRLVTNSLDVHVVVDLDFSKRVQRRLKRHSAADPSLHFTSNAIGTG